MEDLAHYTPQQWEVYCAKALNLSFALQVEGEARRRYGLLVHRAVLTITQFHQQV